jgi:hypothetical protein
MRTSIVSQLRFPLRFALAISAGALALAAGVLFSAATTGEDSSLTLYRDVEMHVARMPAASLKDLLMESDAVVVGRVVAKGETHFLGTDSAAPRPVTPAALPAGLPKEQADALAQANASGPDDGIARPPRGIPMTTFQIEVTRVLKGTVVKGSSIAVTQPGGDVQIPLGAGRPTLQRKVVAEHDPLMLQGQEHVLFLDGSDGNFTIAGGPDGRFNLDARRTLQPIDEGSAVGKAQKGKTVDELEVAIHQAN